MPPPHPMRGPNRLKLGLFGANADGGIGLTRAPERWRAGWDDLVAAARMADEAGFEFFLPIARWRGFGGATAAREHSFETLTEAAALAGLTRRIALFATVHVPMVHPVFAAKALATIDHASGGRAGLNVVCGWSPPEFAAFGLAPVTRRYDQGLEWFEIFRRLSAGEGPFDFQGRYFTLRGVYGRPRPLQAPHPYVLNAGFSDAGRDFAARAADGLFTSILDPAAGAAQVADIEVRAGRGGRAVAMFTFCPVICRASRDEAETVFARVAEAEADTEAVARYMADKETHTESHDPAAYRRHRRRFVLGSGGYPLVGTPRDVAAGLAAIAAAGFAGVGLSFVNYTAELPEFTRTVLPLLAEAGLRAPP